MNKKFEVLITQRAEKDVREIWDYIAKDKRETADKFITELLNQVDRLELLPESFPLIDENEALGIDCYRHLIYKDYRTIFRVQADKVIIIRIIHGSKLLSL